MRITCLIISSDANKSDFDARPPANIRRSGRMDEWNPPSPSSTGRSAPRHPSGAPGPTATRRSAGCACMARPWGRFGEPCAMRCGATATSGTTRSRPRVGTLGDAGLRAAPRRDRPAAGSGRHAHRPRPHPHRGLPPERGYPGAHRAPHARCRAPSSRPPHRRRGGPRPPHRGTVGDGGCRRAPCRGRAAVRGPRSGTSGHPLSR